MSRKDEQIVGITHYIKNNGLPVEIAPLGDLHIGDANCNMTLVKKLISDVANTPNRYAVITGDVMNTAIIGSKSDSYSETMTPDEQLETAVDLLTPIKDKILAIVPGNHEERINRTAGIDTTKTMAKLLGLEDVFRSTSALLFVKFGYSYSLYINHGHGGGRRVGGKMNSLEDFSQIIDVDCYIVGHTHLPATFKRSVYRISPQRGAALPHEQLFVNTASALKYGGYGDRNGYAPASNSYPVITLDNTSHSMTVTL